jgi:F-type H+-transporting ATPase subunit epsilon
MEESFKLEIISPEKIIFSDMVKMVKIPSYEGDMSILKNHISIITFLRPGIIKVENNDNSFEDFFAQDGTVEFFNNTLVLLSASAENIKNLSKNFLENLKNDAQNILTKNDISDQDRYILNHKLDTLKEIRT